MSTSLTRVTMSLPACTITTAGSKSGTVKGIKFDFGEYYVVTFAEDVWVNNDEAEEESIANMFLFMLTDLGCKANLDWRDPRTLWIIPEGNVVGGGV